MDHARAVAPTIRWTGPSWARTWWSARPPDAVLGSDKPVKVVAGRQAARHGRSGRDSRGDQPGGRGRRLMATLTADAPPSAPAPETRRGLSWFAVRGPAQVIAAIGAVLAVWIVLFTVFRGTQHPRARAGRHQCAAQLAHRPADQSRRRTEHQPPVHLRVQPDPGGDRRVRDRDSGSDRHPVVRPAGPGASAGSVWSRWLAYLAWAFGNWRVALLDAVGFLFIGSAGPVAGEHGHPGADHRGGGVACSSVSRWASGPGCRTGSTGRSPRCWISCRRCRRSSTWLR